MAEDVSLIIKNPRGDDENYPVKAKVRLNTSDGNKIIYSKGEAIENVPITLDFSNGDQTITADDGILMKSAVITKPETLIPENIPEGIIIAGVVGTGKLGGGGAEFEDSSRYLLFNVDPDNNTVILYRILYDQIYADTGTYDVVIPDTIAGMQVAIRSSYTLYN